MITYTHLAGTVDVSVVVRIVDSTDGTPELSVTAATGGLVLEYRRELEAEVSLATITDLAALTTAHTDKGMLHIGDGYYRVDLPDAACATGQRGVLVHGVATGMVIVGAYVHLVAYNPFDAVRLGLTALPNAAANAAGGLPISAAGGLALDTKLANTNEITVARMGALTDWINGGRLDLILDIIAADTTTDIPALIATLQALVDVEVAAILAAVDTEVAAILALLDDARGEPAQGTPPVNPDLATKIDYLYKLFVNKKDNNGTVTQFYNNAGTVVDHKQTTAESAGTVTKGAIVSGP